MAPDEKKRPHRIPLTPEEVAQLVSLKKMREAKKLAQFKSSFSYKAFNIFNICCFFIYWEIIFCYLGPCHYQTHYSKSYSVKRSSIGKWVTSELNIVGVDNTHYKFMANGSVKIPNQKFSFQLGKDYILQRELKARIENWDETYRVQTASPILFLSVFVIVVSGISFFYNLNEHPHSLRAVALMNAITILAFLTI